MTVTCIYIIREEQQTKGLKMKLTKADNYIEPTFSGWYVVFYLDKELNSYTRKMFDTRTEAREFVKSMKYFK